MRARWISWATSGRCSSSVISPPVRAGSSSCSACCPGISTEQLRSRLNRMVADGLLTRQRYREVPPRVDYELTERSRELIPVLGALARWGYDWTWSAPRPGRGRQCRRDLPARAGHSRAAGGARGHRRADRGGRGRRARAPVPGHAHGRPRRDLRGRRSAADGAPCAARSQAWVRALGPEGSTESLQISGRDGLAGAVLDGFSRASDACSLGRGLVRALTPGAAARRRRLARRPRRARPCRAMSDRGPR